MKKEKKDEYKQFGWYYSDGEHRGFHTTYEFETVGWKVIKPLYEKISN